MTIRLGALLERRFTGIVYRVKCRSSICVGLIRHPAGWRVWWVPAERVQREFRTIQSAARNA